ncbi:MAG: BMP family protein [Candidatus Limnocylindrales bacterium]
MRLSRKAVATFASAVIMFAACNAAASPTPTTGPTTAPTTAPTAGPPTASPKAFLTCMVSDVAGIDDHAFNANAWKGVQDAGTKLGIETKVLQSKAASDYDKNLAQFVTDGCKMIVSVGFLLADATAAAAKANPTIRYAIVDDAYDPAIPNVEGLVYSTNEAAMLAGYAAAAWSKTHVLATFGGINIGGPVTDFMDGFVAGAHYYDKAKGTKTTVLGWDPVTKKGAFTGNFTSIDDGKTLSLGFLDENADVIMGVGGAIGQGAFAAIIDRGAAAAALGVDVDWYESVIPSQPTYAALLLTSVLKKIDVSVEAAVERAYNDQPATPVFVSNLKNGGVDLGPFHNFDSQITDATKSEIAALKAAIIDGSVKVSDYFAAP